MTALLDALAIKPDDVVAIVGAGGKTTLAFRLVQAALARGERAIFSTTTQIWRPAASAFDRIVATAQADGLRDDAGWRSAAVIDTLAVSDGTPIDGATMPTVRTKVGGADLGSIERLRGAALLVIEADGARGLRIKAPGLNEPQIPPFATVVCVVASLAAIGRPLDDRIAHRVDRVAALTRTMPGSMITPTLIETLLTHPDGGLRGIPEGARRIAVLSHSGEAPAEAAGLIEALLKGGFDHAVTLGLT